MREILFRGKRTTDGEWCEGNLFIDEKDEKHEILLGYTNYRIAWEVISETVGQFTGLTDKNGEKIFEGDIVITNKFNNPSKKYIVKYNLSFASFIGEDKNEMFFTTFDGDSNDFEVIGNVHDNPELLRNEQE